MQTNQPLYTTSVEGSAYYTPGTTLETPTSGYGPTFVQSTSYAQPTVTQTTAPALFSFQAPIGNFTHSLRTVEPFSNFSSPAVIPTTYTGTSTMIPASTGGFQQANENTSLGNTNVSQLELTKRLLDNDREVQLKYADMEADKQKKLEDKAEKQRAKAAKWKSRNVNAMVHKHEKKAAKLEMEAHTHYMKAEDYKTTAKELERQRKQYDPPQDKKDEKKQPGKKSDDKKEEKKADNAKDDKKPAVDTRKPEGEDAKSGDHSKSSPAPRQNSGSPVPQQQEVGSQSPIDPNRPKQAAIPEKRDPNARYQQDVSTAALRYAKARDDYIAAEQQQALQQQQAAPTGLGRP